MHGHAGTGSDALVPVKLWCYYIQRQSVQLCAANFVVTVLGRPANGCYSPHTFVCIVYLGQCNTKFAL